MNYDYRGALGLRHSLKDLRLADHPMKFPYLHLHLYFTSHICTLKYRVPIQMYISVCIFVTYYS